MTGPDPNSIYPNENIRQVVYIKNVISRPNILVGDYTYYDDIDGAEKFEEHVTHHYDFLGDRLIIGKFCAIARGIEFIMNGANHRMNTSAMGPLSPPTPLWRRTFRRTASRAAIAARSFAAGSTKSSRRIFWSSNGGIGTRKKSSATWKHSAAAILRRSGI